MSKISAHIDLIDTESGSESDEIEESIRVLWTRNMRLHHAEIAPSEPLDKVFKLMARLYDTPADRITLRYKEEPINRTDTLQTLGFNVIRDSLYASKLESSCTETEQTISSLTKPGNNKIRVKCLVKDSKKPLEYYVNPTAPLKPLFTQIAKDLCTAEAKVKIRFDGEVLNAKQTPNQLDIEGDECLEIYTN